ncbi:MAG TPA: N-acetylmuramidase family protein [Pyrinomonadaceae bacterium]|nr:N-acetylmuramidase family protein [Pyrinomonadaceae bacterium]
MPILRAGSSGPDVTNLQQSLKNLGFDPKGVDGHFGPGTKNAVIAFQKSKGLTADGIAGPATLAALQSVAGGESAVNASAAPAGVSATGGSPTTSSKALSESDYVEAAALLKCDVPAIKAVAEVESSGAGFLKDGRPKILFERHKFREFTNGRHNQKHPDISGARGGYGASGAHQWERFSEAFALDPSAAIQSCSWGKFQVMGFNFRISGFKNPEDFRAAMEKSEGEHLKAFCNFITGNSLDGALRKLQWAKLAEGYNGAKYRENRYDTKLAAAYKKYSKI